MDINFRSFLAIFIVSSLISGCTSLPPSSAINSQAYAAGFEQQWVNDVPNTEVKQLGLSPWITTFKSSALNLAIEQAMLSNHAIIESQAALMKAQQQVVISKGALQPSASISTQGSRTKSSAGTTSNQYELTLNTQYEIDLWGKLNEQQKIANLDFSRAKANLRRAQYTLKTNITSAWYKVLSAQQLLALLEKRAQNLKAQLQSIETSYRRGLIQSLDIYLARNNEQSALAQVVNQRQLLHDNSRSLQLLLGKYPSGKLRLDGELPRIVDDLETGVPASLMRQRADLNSLWLAVLAQDSQVAANYLDKFPSFTLNGNLAASSVQLSDLLTQNLAWSLIANLSQTLFDGGVKEATLQSAKATLIEREQQYLQALDNALSEVEGLLQQADSLNEREKINHQALLNAKFAERQVQTQYQNGIANYSQVLDVQRTLYSAQQDVIDLRQQIIESRIALILALGGDPLDK